MKKGIYIYSFLFGLIISSQSFAQITISTDGDVAIGTTTTTSIYKVPVLCDNSTDCDTSTRGGIYSISKNGSTNKSIIGEVQNAYSGYGVYGYATASGSGTDYNRGVYGRAQGAQLLNYGIHGSASGTNSWAGYFSGSVYTTGSYQSSDQRLKKNIVDLKAGEMLSRLDLLKPKMYEYLSEEELRGQNLPSLNTKSGTHYGLIAQELEAVFPELVIDVLHVLENEDGSGGFDKHVDGGVETVTTKAINYQELTVVLLAAVQELQQKVEALEAELNKN